MIATNAPNWTAIAMLSPQQKKLLSRHSLKREAVKGEFIFKEGNPADKIFLLLDGLVFIEKANESEVAQKLVKYIVQPGEVFGEKNLWSKINKQDRAIVRSATATFLQIDVPAFQSILEENSVFSQYFLDAIFHRLRQVEDRCVALNLSSTRMRLKQLLLSFIKSNTQVASDQEIVIRHNLSLKEMGSMVRATAQTMSSILNDWRGRGLLDFTKECVMIRDYEGFLSV